MSAMGDRGLDKKPKKRRYTEESTGVADWASVNPEQLRATIVAVTRDGSAIRFGYSRDGGAYAIGLYEQGEHYTIWCSPHEDLDIKLRSIEQSFLDGPSPEPSESPRKKPM